MTRLNRGNGRSNSSQKSQERVKSVTPSVGRKVSVCLLTYNHVNLVDSTIQSVLDQTVEDYEVIVSDDCSTDGTWERILDLAAGNTRIRAVRTARNRGMPGNANFAVSQSQRPYIALLHHDDIYRNDLLEKWAGVLDRHEDAAFVFNPYGIFESDFVWGDPMPDECFDGKWLLQKFLLPRWGCIVRGTAMIRRDAWLQLGGMRERFNLLADVDLWMRLAVRWDVGYVDEPVIIVRQQRPSYYPEIYQGRSFSWRRQRFLYEIHSANRLESLNLHTLAGRLQWWKFRFRLSRETLKWLAYGLIKKKPAVIASSSDGITPYDLWPLRVIRWLLVIVSQSQRNGDMLGCY